MISETTSFNNGNPPDIIWCCAGSSHPTLFLDMPVEQIRGQMDSNYFSSAYIAHAALQAWLRPKDKKSLTTEHSESQQTKGSSLAPRHLIFTSSFLGLYSIASYGAYSPSKTALRCLSDTLSQEVKLYEGAYPAEPRIRLHTIFPAGITGEAFDAENRIKPDLTKKFEESDVPQSPEECARICIAGLERGDELVTTIWLTRLVMGGVLGASLRNWPWMGLLDTFIAWLMSFVMVFVRWDMDREVRRWGREHGPSGMKRQGVAAGEVEGVKK